jgi:peroxiredoxin (alkyl hydroperoxide reductase subunit C)
MALLVGRTAPDFVATAVKGKKIIDKFRLSDLKGKNIVLFFYPLDFTFVCPTELHAFNDRIEDFRKRDTELVAVSVDSHYSHYAWLSTPKSQGGIQGIEYPVVSDIKKEISKAYDVLFEDQGVAYRGLFLIDDKFIVRHQLVNDLPLGRSVNEVLRMIDALQYYTGHGEVCPANWQKGERAIIPTSEGVKDYFSVT